MTAVAVDPGVQAEPESEQPRLTPANFREELDRRHPTTRTYGPACKILGPQWFEGWENAGRQAARDAEQEYLRANREAWAEEDERVYGPLTARLAQWREEAAGTTAAEGDTADSAGPEGFPSPGPAEASTGEAE